MNKIFKIVWNAARGKMMVVNEATSSVQTGKKAAVTVAVIGALASGAALADEATGIVTKADGDLTESVYGGGKVEPGTYNVGATGVLLKNVTGNGVYVGGGPLVAQTQNGQSFKVSYTGGSEADEADGKVATSVSISDSKFTGTSFFLGAGYVKGDGKANNFDPTVKVYGSSVALDNVKAESSYVVGGARIHEGRNATVEVTNTDVSLTGNTVVKTVVGGSFIGGTRSQYVKQVKTDSANVYIGKDAVVSDLVVGGHLYNYHGTDAVINKTNVVIDGAKLGEGAVVIGGSYLELLGTANGSIESNTKVVKTSITLKNGAEVGNVYGGDYLVTGGKNYALDSTANEVSLIIKDSKVNGNVIGGSYVEGDNASADVTNAVSIQIKGSEVVGTITTDNVEQGEFVANSITDSEIDLTNVQAGAVVASKGTVELRAEGKEGTTSIGELTVDDGVTVALSADGAANDAAGGDIKKVVKIGNSDYNATVDMAAGEVIGAVTATVKDGEVTDKTVAVNEKTESLADKVTLAPQMIQRIMMNDLRKRMGDIRAGEGTHGAWARYNGGEMAGNGVDADFHMVQVGIDTVPVADAPRFGVAFSYAQAESEDGIGTADMDAFSLAFYGTKMYDNGLFVDVIGRMATVDTDFVNNGATGKMDNVALSLSGEFGWRFDVTDSFFIEPSVEATYTYTNADTFTMTNGGTYELEATDSLIGRAGFAAGFKCPNNFGDVYVRAAVVHEFMGDVTMNSRTAGGAAEPVNADGEDTYLEYAIGAQFNVNKNTYVYADIERTEGAKLEEDWRANVGVRFAF